MSITKMIFIAFAPVLLGGCAGRPMGQGGPEGHDGTRGPGAKPPEISENFNKTANDWLGGHSDYTSDTQPTDVVVKPRRLPGLFGGYGLYTAGTNRSDDLFIYIKKKFTGFAPNQDYLLTFSVTFLTDAPAGCVGVGGAPGEAVFLKAGAAPVEPLTVAVDTEYRMNIDKGN